MEKEYNWYKTLFNITSEAVIVVEPETWAIMEANETAKELLQITDSSNKFIYLEFEDIYNSLKKSKSESIRTDYKFKIANNKELELEVNAGLFKYEKEELILAVLRNKDEADSLTERLIQADKLVLLGQLSAGVAHEIRNPLAAVNLNLQLLARKFAEGSNEYDSIQTALQGVERISRIVEITLNFSKPAIPDIKKIDVNSIIPTSLDLVSVELKKKQIKVHTNLASNLPLISADTKQIQQVLINLLTNASDSINGDGKIIIKTYTEEFKSSKSQKVVLAVEDNGIGIPQQDLSKIFNPFYTKKSNGTGLGLSISQRIVQEHKGKIEVISREGKGTIFKVHLPV